MGEEFNFLVVEIFVFPECELLRELLNHFPLDLYQPNNVSNQNNNLKNFKTPQKKRSLP